MIRLFKNVWLCHEHENLSTSPSTTTYPGEALLGAERESFWFLLFKRDAPVRIICNQPQFIQIFALFFHQVLKRNDASNINYLLELYELDLRFKNPGVRTNPLEESTRLRLIEDAFELAQDCGSSLFQQLQVSDLGFEFMLPNFLLSKEPKKKILEYVKWCCWSLLAGEFRIYAEDIQRDIFNAHCIFEENPHLERLSPKDVYKTIAHLESWRLLADSKITEVFDLDQCDQGVRNIKEIFPTWESALKIFNNHARGHRDEQGVDSFKEPVKMIYEERYEELLFRDLLNDFRLTYASDHLGEIVVCTYLSRIHKAFLDHSHQGIDPTPIYESFEVK